jgi:hypothetical protein
MEAKQPVYRTDADLTRMLDQHGTWVVHSANNQVIGVGTSLRRALQRASDHMRSGIAVANVTRVPPNRIFVFHDQVVRLTEATQEREHTMGGSAIRVIGNFV